MAAQIQSRIRFPHRCHPDRMSGPRDCCLAVKDPLKKPDPAIYSQIEQLSIGQDPSWNSPDITTNTFSQLLDETRVKVRNLSSTTSAANALVHFFTSAFGIGMRRTQETSRVVSLSPGEEVELLFPLRQEILNGDPEIGTYIAIEHPHDETLINNKGAQISRGVVTSEAGRTLQFAFPVLNQLAVTRQITLSVLSNELSASVTPTIHNFAPLEQIEATITMQVPDTIHGSPGSEIYKEVTVIGWDLGVNLVDGLTHIVRIDN